MYIQSTQYMGWASEFDWHQLSISLGTLVAAYRQALQDNFPMKNSPDSEVKRKLIVIWQKNYSMIQWQKLFLVIAVTIPIYTMLKHHTWVGETHLKLWDCQFFTEKSIASYCRNVPGEGSIALFNSFSQRNCLLEGCQLWGESLRNKHFFSALEQQLRSASALVRFPNPLAFGSGLGERTP